MFRFVLDIYDTDAIAINKLCKLNFMYFTMYLAISQQQGYQGFFLNMVFTFFETLQLRNKHVAINMGINVKYLKIPII